MVCYGVKFTFFYLLETNSELLYLNVRDFNDDTSQSKLYKFS